MKLTFLSNYFSHHQQYICSNWHRLTNGDFTFVANEEFSDERLKMGWSQDSDVDFVVSSKNVSADKLSSVVNESDVVILGSAPLDMVTQRLKTGKTVIKYSERVFKSGYNPLKWPARLITYYKNYGRHKSMYLLCASAYTAVDYAIHGTFINKSYKWGYFPETQHYDVAELMKNKTRNKLLWCGRFIDWKHPEDALCVASRLKNEGYTFTLEMIGTGELQYMLEKKIEEYNISDCVKILGSMSPKEVRKHMEEASIYLFTSDFNEGWGAVLNESMNSGCAVVANHAIGSVPYLIKHKENGLIYQNEDKEGLYQKVKYLLNNPDIAENLGRKAYDTIVTLWNAEVAAERFISFCNEINQKGSCELFDEGPCSKAEVIKNTWFRENW